MLEFRLKDDIASVAKTLTMYPNILPEAWDPRTPQLVVLTQNRPAVP